MEARRKELDWYCRRWHSKTRTTSSLLFPLPLLLPLFLPLPSVPAVPFSLLPLLLSISSNLLLPLLLVRLLLRSPPNQPPTVTIPYLIIPPLPTSPPLPTPPVSPTFLLNYLALPLPLLTFFVNLLIWADSLSLLLPLALTTTCYFLLTSLLSLNRPPTTTLHVLLLHLLHLLPLLDSNTT